MGSTYALVASFAQQVGVIFFMTLFAGVLFYALRPKNGSTFSAAAEIPLKED
jgi:cytochrome c oxidase cbb3-type subunit IV